MGHCILRLPKWLKIGCVCLVFGAAASESASGSIVFDTGNINDVNNVLMDDGQQGTQLNGTVDATFDVLFTQPTLPEDIKTGGLGQSTILSVDGNGFTSIRTQLTDGNLFGRFSINAIFDLAGVQFQAVGSDGTIALFTAGNGENRINAIGTNGTLIQYIDIIATNPTNSINTIKQVRIGAIVPAAVPEASSWILLAGALSMGLMVHIIRRRRAGPLAMTSMA